jgi:DNA-binding MarR family transcriptional regulator
VIACSARAGGGVTQQLSRLSPQRRNGFTPSEKKVQFIQTAGRAATSARSDQVPGRPLPSGWAAATGSVTDRRSIGIDDGFVASDVALVAAANPAPSTDVATVAAAIARLYPEVYLLLHRRSGETHQRLTPQSQAILQHLTYSGPLTVGEMAKHLGRAQSVISETVHALEQRGLLARIRDERDRRRTLVWLTDAAHGLLAELREVLDRERIAAAVGAMSNDERRALLEGLEALVGAAARVRHRKDTKR